VGVSDDVADNFEDSTELHNAVGDVLHEVAEDKSERDVR
jgi:hypothetical protein